jgi:biopolymer transport protein ExbB
MTLSARHRSWRWLALFVLTIAIAFLAAGLATAADENPPAPTGGGSPSVGGLFDFIGHFIRSLGPLGLIVLGSLSVALVAFIILLALDLRTGAIIPGGFVEEFTDTVNKRKFKEAFDLARTDNSFLGKVLTAGMSRLQYGLEDAREASANMLDTIKSSKEQINSYLAVIGTVGPLLGLVGTVFGMIKAFMALNQPGASIDPKTLADGISHALCMTLAGVGLAVPAIFFNAFFKNRIMKVSMECGNISDDLLTQMYHNSKKPAPPSTTITPPPAAAADARTSMSPVKPV